MLAVSGQNQRTYRENINGRQRSVYELSVNVFPRQEGEISTGALKVNGKDLEPAILKVGGDDVSNKLPISFNASVNTHDVYPQEAILYTIKLTDGAGLLNAQISNPVIESARITPLNMDKSYQDYQDNARVQIFERSFAVIPDKSGYLTIPPIELYGSVATREQDYMGDLFAQGLLFDGFASPQKSIRLETQPIQVRVLEKPSDWKGWWLPSTRVNLTAEDSIPDTVSVGDSITRTIRLTAMNTPAETLPSLKQPASEGLKAYPSPEQRETIQTPVGDLQGTLTSSIVFVPTRGGELKLPAVEVLWFNTKTGQTERAAIPEKTIQVQGEAPVQPVIKEDPTKKTPTTTVQNAPPKEQKAAQLQTDTSSESFNLLWVIGFAILGIVIGGATGYWLSHHYRKRKHSYHLADKNHSKKKKVKKPIPDLYPF
jgi:hypothetical protein